MTEENHQTESSGSTMRSSPLVQAETQANILDPATKIRDVKKEKCRAMTKVVIRRLPPSMNQSQFVEQISPLPEHDYLYFVKADMSLGQYAFSRAYINFTDQRDIFIFREKFDNYVFVDSKGTEYPAVVEFAPFQRLIKKRAGKKKDGKCGSIESDPYYISFLETLQNLDSDSTPAQPKTEYSYQPADNSQKKVTTTPLLEYLKQRKQEKQRLKDEKREERRRRDLERRRAKDEPTISKVLKNPEMEKEVNLKESGKDEKDKLTVKEAKSRNKRQEDKGREKAGGRERDGKLQGNKQPFSRERNEERNRDAKHQKRNDEKRSHGKRDERDREGPREERKNDEKYSKERKLEEKYNKDRKLDSKDETRETKERKGLEEKRGKSYEKMRPEKKRLSENKRGGAGDSSGKGNSTKTGSSRREERDVTEKREKKIEISQNSTKASLVDTSIVENSLVDSASQRDEIFEAEISPSRLELDLARETTKSSNRRRDRQDFEDEICGRSRFHESNSLEFDDRECSSIKKHSKFVLRRSSLESGAEGVCGEGSRLRRHKSLDGGERDNLRKNDNRYKTKDKKDPRLERRIRNKDRPAMEIYRPGMGRFSKQRLEREKSMNDDRASLSQSPTPGGSSPSSNPKSSSNKPTTTASSPSSEVRTMTFKRSASRDLP